jgi:hypothetical protein
MVDSGQQVSWGERDYRAEYKKKIDAELRRPGLLIINAVRERPSPSEFIVKAQVTNVSTYTLDTALNSAMMHIKLYEGHKALQTGRIVHASEYAYFHDPLKPGDTRYFEFPFGQIQGVNMSKIDAILMVDFMPDLMAGRWDMMQAAIAKSGELPPSPTPYPTVTATPVPTEVPPTPEPTVEPTVAPEYHEIYLPAAVRRYGLG